MFLLIYPHVPASFHGKEDILDFPAFHYWTYFSSCIHSLTKTSFACYNTEIEPVKVNVHTAINCQACIISRRVKSTLLHTKKQFPVKLGWYK